jgi:hypothetical protein
MKAPFVAPIQDPVRYRTVRNGFKLWNVTPRPRLCQHKVAKFFPDLSRFTSAFRIFSAFSFVRFFVQEKVQCAIGAADEIRYVDLQVQSHVESQKRSPNNKVY